MTGPRGAALAAALLLAAPAPRPAAGAGEEAPRRPAEARTIPFALPSPEEAWLGVGLAPATAATGAGVRLASVAPGSPAEAAGLRAGDLLLSLDGVEPPDAEAAEWMLRLRFPGDRVRVEFRRGADDGSVPATLGRRPGAGALHRGAAFRLAVIPLSFEDRPRPLQPSDDLLDRSLFSVGAFRDAFPSGRRAHGSLREYFRDQSLGALDVVGRVLPTVALPATAASFAHQPMGAGPDSVFARALAQVQAVRGAGALDGFDGVAFLYPGSVASPPRRALWPHRGTARAGGRVLPYLVKNLGHAPEPEPIGVLCHEFGHLLGLPDQYGEAHRTGVGDFCLMALGHRGGGESGADRPFSLCAWCRTVLGWCRPAAVDPAAPQDLALRPWTTGPGEAFVLPGAAPGEAFLLEHRPALGWDAELPGGGLLLWRAGAPARPGDPPDRPWLDLVEAHGIDAPDASLLRPDEIPFPGRRGGAYTPETHPRDGAALRLTRAARRPDGSISFRVGDATPVAAPPAREAPLEVDAAGFALLDDPVTGARVPVRVRAAPGEGDPASPVRPGPPPADPAADW